MTPSWEAINALATAVSALVVTVAVILGYRQLRVTADQLRALRLGTQLDGTMRIFDELSAEEFRDARRFVLNELSERMQDEHYRLDVARVGMADEHTHRELTALRVFEKVATYVRHGILEGAIIYDFAGPWIVNCWSRVAETGVIALHRETFGHTLWENFEWLNAEARAWMTAHGSDPDQYATQRLSEGTRSGPKSDRQE